MHDTRPRIRTLLPPAITGLFDPTPASITISDWSSSRSLDSRSDGEIREHFTANGVEIRGSTRLALLRLGEFLTRADVQPL